MRSRPKKRLRKLLVPAAFGTVTLILYASRTVRKDAGTKVFRNAFAIPHKRVALVLGCAPVLGGGMPNGFFENRMDAAARLFRAGKADYLLLSGDNHSVDYDEPTAMKQALIDRGVPEERLVLDYAGFSTSDSIIRAKKVFGVDDLCVVSQPDHIMRAIYIADHHGVDAIGFAAGEIAVRYSWRTRVRESLARVRTLFDVHVWDRQPHFLGPRIPIGNQDGSGSPNEQEPLSS
jgi:SanA protein